MGREQVAPANAVQLVGRVSGDPTERELPSGDRVVQLRVVVPRPTRRGRAYAGTGKETVAKKPMAGDRPRAQVDTIDVACWTGRARAAALRLPDGAGVQVAGALRRRFFRTGSGRVSRYEVEASVIRRVDLV
ncbi:single-stranded DNA-binding protein [Ornithinimicrobium pratense]|uniref:Single-stranded DNA-binding protein n=1 Tax=Ornithinimicrobium pratense TaxID=2593973 RepID=A0A5J6V4E8_9MICO|nr:single-stranded DNA-binding protein [Ornithinimicrobium pratense]QFG68635.1 single-stranded DNA-binding protein [Ornithinimicrobium pratense]